MTTLINCNLSVKLSESIDYFMSVLCKYTEEVKTKTLALPEICPDPEKPYLPIELSWQNRDLSHMETTSSRAVHICP